MFDKNH